MKKSKLPEGDDGKTIADMNVDGMPWYLERLHRDDAPAGDAYRMNKKEGRAYMWGALGAALLVVTVFSVFFAIVILLLLSWFN